jgi:hypothetical protein
MDPELQKRIDEARAEGYTEEEIQAYLRGTTNTPVPEFDQPGRGAEIAGTVAAAAGPTAIKYGVGAGAAYAGYKALEKGIPAARQAISNFQNRNAPIKAVPPSATPAPTSPNATRIPIQYPSATPKPMPGYGSVSYNVPVSGPTAPPAVTPAPAPTAPPAPAAAQPGILQRGMDYASKMREIAANKVMNNAGLIKQAGVGAAALLTPGNVGQQYNFPTKGPYAGMEINPMTGRPWTPEELAQYR